MQELENKVDDIDFRELARRFGITEEKARELIKIGATRVLQEAAQAIDPDRSRKIRLFGWTLISWKPRKVKKALEVLQQAQLLFGKKVL